MKFLIALAAGLVLVGTSIAHAGPWPEIIDPYPAEAKIDKPLAVTIDATDDLWRAKSLLKGSSIDSLMEELAKLGFDQVNWVTDNEQFLTDLNFSDVQPRDGMRYIAAAAHRNGMKFYALFKPFETGCVGEELPLTVILPPDVPLMPTLTGRMGRFASFLQEHPEMRIERRPVDARLGTPVAIIKLVKEDDAPTRLDRKHIELFIGQENGAFEPYDGPISFTNAVEQRDGKPARVLTLSGLKIDLAYQYFAIRTTFGQEGKEDFNNACSRLMELRDGKGRPLPSTSDRGVMDRNAIDQYLAVLWLFRTGHWGVPSEYALSPTFGTTPQTTAYWFGIVQESNNDPQRALDAPGGGYIAGVRGKQQYMNTLQPMYPQVRAYWLRQIKSLIDDGVDGITLRVDNHSSWYTEPYEYGFNPPVVEAYRKKYGVDILTQPFDRDKWRALQGDAYTQFVREARELTQKHHVKLQLSINQLMGDAMPYWRLNNVPVTIQWQWKRWIEEKLCDSVELKLIPWPWGYYAGSGTEMAREVIALAHARRMPVWANARLQTWWLMNSDSKEAPLKKLSQDDVNQIVERLCWVWRSRTIDGMIVYENMDFAYLDSKTGKAYISPAFQTIMEHLRKGTARDLRAEDLKTFYLDQPSTQP